VRRKDLEHIIRAAADIADDDEIVVIGSQSVLGQFPDAPEELCVSMEADVFPRNHPERWNLIDGSIGELSPFHQTFGYYAQGVEEGTAVLPRGWQDRLVLIQNQNTRGAKGLCLEIHDLVIAKYVAGREKDRRFNRAAARHALVSQSTLVERLDGTPVEPVARERIRSLIGLDFAGLVRPG
jgi:hypothetical protein